MKIPSPAISSPDTHTQLTIPVKTDSLPPLFVGEVADAEVLNNLRGGKVSILLKHSTVTADSAVPLEKGDRIAVEVARLHPRVILRIVHSGIPEKSAALREYIQLYQANPRSLFTCLVKGYDLFRPGGLGELEAYLGKDDVRYVQNTLQTLIYPGEGSRGGTFLKDYLTTLGYLIEHGPAGEQRKRMGGTADGKLAAHTMKGILTKLSGRLQWLMDTEKLPGAERLSRFVSSSSTAIDVHQVINYLFQEYEGKYMFQIPMRFPENMGLAEIFVKFERHRGRQGDKRILFLLNMDVLGDVTVEAVVRQNRIGCEFTCRDSTVSDFVGLYLGELGEGLAALGYDIEYMRCVVEKDTVVTREEYDGVAHLFSRQGVDIVV